MGITDGSTTYGIIRATDTNVARINTVTNDPAQPVGTSASSTNGPSNVLYGITTDPTKSGIEAHLVENTTSQLYFKVANAVQNLELLDAGEVLEAVADIVPKNSELITSYCCPDYQNGIVGASALGAEQTFVAPSNGIISYSISAYNISSASYIKINDVEILNSTGYANEFNSLTGTAIVAKGDVIKYFSSYNALTYNTQNIIFFPMKGAN